MAKRVVTRDEFIKALEDNGYPQIRGDYMRNNPNGSLEGACAFGQAALNLGVHASSLAAALSGSAHYELSDNIILWNDEFMLTIPEIVDKIKDLQLDDFKIEVDLTDYTYLGKNFHGVTVPITEVIE